MTRTLGNDLETNTKTAQKLVQEGLATIEDMTTALRKLDAYTTSELKKGSQQLVRTSKTRSEYKVARHLAEFSNAFQALLDRLKVPDDPQAPTPAGVRQFHDSSILFAQDVKTLFTKYRVILYAPWIRSRKEFKTLRSSVLAFGKKMVELKQFSDEQFSLNREAEVFLRRLAQLRTRHQTLIQIQQQLRTLQQEEQEALDRKRALERQLKTLQKNSRFHEWEQIHRNKYGLDQKIRQVIRPLKRALKKIENQAETVQALFTARAMANIGIYQEDPYHAFVAADDGPNVLIEIARGIKESIQTEKLMIDKARGRKALEAAKRVIQNPRHLHNLMAVHLELEAAIAQFRSSPDTEALFTEITRIEAQSKEVDQLLRKIARQSKRIKTNLTKEQNILDEQKAELEKLARTLTGKPLKIVDA